MENSTISDQFPTPKKIVLEGLKRKVAELGSLGVPFDFSFEYPNRESFPVNQSGTRNSVRRVVLKRISNTKNLDAIGREFTSYSNFEALETQETYTQNTPIGWMEDWVLEVSVWSTDAKDRDNLLELIKLWMLELEQQPEAGYDEPFFIRNLIYYCQWKSSKEEIEEKIADNIKLFVGKSTYEFLFPFFGISSETYRKYKINLQTEVIQFPGTVVRIPDKIGLGNSTGPGMTPKEEIELKLKKGFRKLHRFSLEVNTPVFNNRSFSASQKSMDTTIIKDKPK